MDPYGGGYNPYGYSGGPPPFDAPPYDAPQYGAPQYGNPSYGVPQYSAPQYESPQYGASQYSTPTFENPELMNQQYGNPHDNNGGHSLSGPMSIFKPFDRDNDGKITENGFILIFLISNHE